MKAVEVEKAESVDEKGRERKRSGSLTKFFKNQFSKKGKKKAKAALSFYYFPCGLWRVLSRQHSSSVAVNHPRRARGDEKSKRG